MTTPTLPLQIDRRAVQRALPALRGQAAHQAEGLYAEAAEGTVSTLDTSEAAARLSLLREAMAAALRLEANKQHNTKRDDKNESLTFLSHMPHSHVLIHIIEYNTIEYNTEYTSLGRFSCFCTSLVVAGCLARRARLR